MGDDKDNNGKPQAEEAFADENPTPGSGDDRPKVESDKSFLRRWVNQSQYKIWDDAFPIAIKDLSVNKDDSYKKAGRDGPKRTPTVATAILGFWLSDKIGLGGTKPSIPDDDDAKAGELADSAGFVVRNIRAVLVPGESTLIVGPSSSGKSTLMRYIADSVEGKVGKNKEGEVLVGGLDPTHKDNANKFRRTTAFGDQGDLTLTPILTVEETLEFTYGIAETNDPEFNKESVAAALRLAGLSHVAKTVVGNADIRGVSGGQKRRVKVLEKIAGDDIRVMFLDEITNGLDSASALSMCELVKASVESTGATAMACLLQPSVAAYNTFHRIIVLTIDGEMAYSGPREGAVPHFESLGLVKPEDMDEPEYLLRCAYSPSQFYPSESGTFPSGVVSPKGLVKRFADSEAGKALSDELDAAATPHMSENAKPPTRKPNFARPFFQQVKILLGRGWKLIQRSPNTIGRIITAIIFGLFIGTLFLNAPEDLTSGSIQRAGYSFTLMFLLFLTSSEGPQEDIYHDRITFYNHRQANFYRSSAYYLASVMNSMPIFIAEAVLFSSLSFFLVGMESYGGGGFFYFMLICILTTLCGGSLSRLLSYTLPTEEVAATIGPAVLVVFSTTSCFTPNYPNIPGWIRWFAWISPPAYAFEAMMVNDFRTRCVPSDLLQDGDCMSGEEALYASLKLPRKDLFGYKNTGIDSDATNLLAFDAGMIVLLTLIFELAGVYFLHKSQDWYGPKTKRFQVSSGMSLGTAPSLGHKEDETDGDEIPSAPLAHLTCDTIVYEVDVDIDPEESKVEVKPEDESVNENPGVTASISYNDADEEESALPITAREYGQVGRGAATEWLLKKRLGESSVRSLRSESALVADAKIDSSGVHIAELAPAEPGRLRLLSGITGSFRPGTTTALMGSSGAGKTALLDVLAGYKTGGHIMGDIKINGIPKTEKTWKSIAGYCEQTDLHNPAITLRESIIFSARLRLRPFDMPDEKKIAFADEIIQILELEDYAEVLVGKEAAGEGLPKHARKRLTVGVEMAMNPSILFADEPTSGLDSLSADLVIKCMSKAAKTKGLTVLCTIHQPSREVFLAFDNLLLLRKGGQVTYNGPIASMSDYMVSASGNDGYAMPEGANPADHALDVFCGPGGEKDDWAKLYKSSDMARDMVAINASNESEHGEITVEGTERSSTYELYQVVYRQIVAHWRTPEYMSIRLGWTITASILLAVIFMNQPDTASGAQNTIGGLFFFTTVGTVPMITASVPLVAERAVMYRETASGTYSKPIYGLAVQLAEIPFNCFMGFVSFILFYFIVGLDTDDGERVIYFLLLVLASYWFLPSLGQFFAFISPNAGAAIAVGSLLMTIFLLTAGFLQLPTEIPGWYIWIYWINPFRYVLQGLSVNELGGGKTYEDDIMAFGGGTVSGDDALQVLFEWSYEDRWWYCYVAIIMMAFGVSIGNMFASQISWLKR
eukprot:CAMPEP_0185727222 /NCGR_PEP_ID=MMETSP1171-20130828/2966_1 /TAXON_ID=374046 /ORGANISM="Helicotheca tamensis, Strain CCMP826" /LENGTH=1454 /DNA_ID=CAMNT_0028395737 /DNA_START=41 /DNA_END=4405 /DNA_ORIENTATION=-